MTTNLTTKEGVIEAVRKTKATNITQFWAKLGNKSKINGAKAKQFRLLVPNLTELFEKNAKGEVVVQEYQKDETTGLEFRPSKVKYYKPRPRVGGYMVSGRAGTIYAEGSKGFKDVDEFVAMIAQLRNEDVALVRFTFNAVAPKTPQPNNPNNKGTVLKKEDDGTFRIVKVV